MQKIKHVVVLCMENHSFEQMFPDNSTIEPAPSFMQFDPPHEFWEQIQQLQGTGPNLDAENFVKAALSSTSANNVSTICKDTKEQRARDVLLSYRPEQIPILTTLAHEFALLDHWFCSVPAATTPNRLFFHAATSGGLVTSPTVGNLLKRRKDCPLKGYKFKNGTIFDQLKDYKIYHGDNVPSVALLHGMSKEFLFGTKFQPFGKWDLSYGFEPGQFHEDCKQGSLPSYSWIEPHYGSLDTFTHGNSQHPMGKIEHGEALIKNVYETLRSSPCWLSSLLIVVYDEHGGFYSSLRPPKTCPTGDDTQYNVLHFDFRSLGMRVPAVVISPWIPKGMVMKEIYEHSSIPKTLEDLFHLKPMTARDQNCLSLLPLCSLETPRLDCPLSLPNITPPPTPSISPTPTNFPIHPMMTLDRCEPPFEAMTPVGASAMTLGFDTTYLANRLDHIKRKASVDANKQLLKRGKKFA
jgi:phospholipase C